MIAEVELLRGKYVANIDEAEPEWPPHPARFFAALVSEYYQRGFDGDEDKRDALRWLQKQDPPKIHFPDTVDQLDVNNYVPTNKETSKGIENRLENSNERKVKKSTVPEERHVYFEWNIEGESSEYLDSIRELALGIPYLGSSESAARINVVSDGEIEINDSYNTIEYTDGTNTDYSIRVPERDELEKLEAFHGRKQRPASGTPVGYRKVYSDSEVGTGEFDEVLVLKRTGGPRPPLEHFYKISKVTRDAMISITDELTEGNVPSVISGHNAQGEPLKHSHIGVIPLANVGNEYADGSVLGVGVVLPDNVTEGDRKIIENIILGNKDLEGRSRLDKLTLGSMGEVDIKYDSEPDLKTLDKKRYTDSSKKWATVTPYVFGRYPRKKSRSEVIAESCRRIDLPSPPEKIQTTDVSPISGVPQPEEFNYDEAHFDSNKLKKHLVLEFSNPVEGPLMLGAGRYFGSGLMTPVSDGGVR
jgi:CRISPR-associated protein Csb2